MGRQLITPRVTSTTEKDVILVRKRVRFRVRQPLGCPAKDLVPPD